MLGPGGVLWLLRHELRLGLRGFVATSKSRSGAGRVFWAIFVAGLLSGGHWAARLLSTIDPVVSPIALGVISVVLLLVATLMLGQALNLISEALYLRADLDLLLASPLPPWRILAVRMAAIAVSVAAAYLIVIGAVWVWLPLFGGWSWMGSAPALLALALAATGVGLIVARGLFALVGPRRTRVAVQVIGAFVGASIFLTLQAQNLLNVDERQAAYLRVLETLAEPFADPSSPLAIPARAVLGDGAAVTTWLVVCAALYALGVWVFGRGFAANAALLAGAGVSRRADARVAPLRGGQMRSLVRKEWRLLVRDPLLLSQILLELVYLIPIFIVFFADHSRLGFGRARLAGFTGAFVLLGARLSGNLAWVTVSAEDAPDLILGAPVLRRRVEAAKAIAAGAPTALLMGIPVTGFALVSPVAALWLAVGVAAAILSSSLVAIWHQRPCSRREFRRRARASMGASLGQLLLELGLAAATGLAVAGWPLASLAPTAVVAGILLVLHQTRPTPAA